MTQIAGATAPKQRMSPMSMIGLVAVLLLAAAWGGYVYQGRQALSAEISRIRSEGYPLSAEGLSRYYPDFGTRHAGKAYLNAMAYLAPPEGDVLSLPYLGGPAVTPRRGAMWPTQTLDAARIHTERNTDAIDMFTQAAQMGGAWFDRRFDGLDQTYLSDMATFREASNLFRLHAAVQMQYGQKDNALATVLTHWRMTEALRDEPIAASHLVRLSMIDDAVQATEQLNASMELSPADLRQIMSVVRERNDGNRGVTRALAGDRAMTFAMFRQQENSNESPQKNGLLSADAIAAVDHDGLKLLLAYRQAFARASGQPSDAAPMPSGQQADDADLAMLAHAADAFINADTRRHVQCDVLMTGLAVQLYQREQGRLPDTLDALVPAILPRVPNDRFGTGPLKYRKTDSGAIVYSVGPDGADNTGRELDDAGHRYTDAATDYTFTLGNAQRELWPEQWGGE
jgi:hypothetical protein